jgi:hypothetical protein
MFGTQTKGADVQAATLEDVVREEAKCLGETLTFGYIGNCGPGYDDRIFEVWIDSLPREQGRTKTAASWRAGAAPTPDELRAEIRRRVPYARLRYRYMTEKSADGRDAILTEIEETLGSEAASRIVRVHGEPDAPR